MFPSGVRKLRLEKGLERRGELAAVLPCDRIGGVEVGEDADHGAADQVALISRRPRSGIRGPRAARRAPPCARPHRARSRRPAPRRPRPASPGRRSRRRRSHRGSRRRPPARPLRRRGPGATWPGRRRYRRGAAPVRAPRAARARRPPPAARRCARAPGRRRTLPPGQAARRRRIRRRSRRRERPSPPGSPGSHSARRAPGWSRCRPWPAPPPPRASPPPPPATGSVVCTARTSRPRSRPRRAPLWSAPGRRARSPLRLRRSACPDVRERLAPAG